MFSGQSINVTGTAIWINAAKREFEIADPEQLIGSAYFG
jgi:hypothetical protein